MSEVQYVHDYDMGVCGGFIVAMSAIIACPSESAYAFGLKVGRLAGLSGRITGPFGRLAFSLEFIIEVFIFPNIWDYR